MPCRSIYDMILYGIAGGDGGLHHLRTAKERCRLMKVSPSSFLSSSPRLLSSASSQSSSRSYAAHVLWSSSSF
ncbi:hypothetical protein RchiOBHm_Chr5g0043331 [Rosa chinensis]|uniref:Uncharacterized protein n=1 Tax=Rosa chinensis TaxID=74649 RepID=A0A2P6QDC9_ROSCH|nr:hypothetical protein RchiOBHm_Chr5g0043331 [Rosa chinensis]